MLAKRNVLAVRGLTLPRTVLRHLDRFGIFAQAQVSLEHQHLAKRYVVRGIESGGAVKDIGRYVTFCGQDGEALRYLHPIDALGVNGPHAVVLAPVLVRVEILRTGRTCQLLITSHEPGRTENGRRPRLVNTVLFRGVNGFLAGGGSDAGVTAFSIPRFWSRSGEEREIPRIFAAAVEAATLGATCLGCSHAHFLAAAAKALGQSQSRQMTAGELVPTAISTNPATPGTAVADQGEPSSTSVETCAAYRVSRAGRLTPG